MQRLAAEKIHRAGRFEKEQGRTSHAPVHNSDRDLLQQGLLLGCERLPARLEGKSMLKFSFEFLNSLRKTGCVHEKKSENSTRTAL